MQLRMPYRRVLWVINVWVIHEIPWWGCVCEGMEEAGKSDDKVGAQCLPTENWSESLAGRWSGGGSCRKAGWLGCRPPTLLTEDQTVEFQTSDLPCQPRESAGLERVNRKSEIVDLVQP
jgi:hypothetical protein